MCGFKLPIAPLANIQIESDRLLILKENLCASASLRLCGVSPAAGGAMDVQKDENSI